MFGFGYEERAASRPPPRGLGRPRSHAIMSIKWRGSEPSSRSWLPPRADLAAEYVARSERLAPLFPRLHAVRTRPLPAGLLLDCRLAYETPQNLALELCKSILYENAGTVDIDNLKSLNSAHADEGEADSLWNGKPQQYFESMNYAAAGADDVRDEDYDADSLAP